MAKQSRYAVSINGGLTWITTTVGSGLIVGEKKTAKAKTYKKIAGPYDVLSIPPFSPPGPTPTTTPTTPTTPTPTQKSIGRFAVVNASSESDADVSAWALACKKQADLHISPYWGYTLDVDIIAKGQTIPDVDFYCGILNNSDEAGVLGWHDYLQGKPLIKIFTAECRKYGIPPATTISHEFAETIGDEDCSTTVRGYDEQGKACLYFRENADPVESDEFGYDIDGVRVSDFITPQWFVKDGFSPLDYMKKCPKPYQIMSGGYMLVSYDNGATWQQKDKFQKGNSQHQFWEQMHKARQGRWDIYQKVFKGEALKKAEIKPGKDVAGGKLFSEGKL